MTTTSASRTTAQIQERARRLRSQAASLHPLLADAYRRRAAELDVEALLDAVWNPPVYEGEAPGPPEGTVRPTRRAHLAVA